MIRTVELDKEPVKDLLDSASSKHTKDILWIGYNLPNIRTPIFKFQHIKKIDKDITYRLINHWENCGLISPGRVGGENGWRHFSIVDCFVLLLIRDLKKFGLTAKKIVEILGGQLKNETYVLISLNRIEYVILNTLLKKEYGLILLLGGKGNILPVESLFEFFKEVNAWTCEFLHLPVSEYVIRILRIYNHELKIDSYEKALFLNPQYYRLAKLIEEGTYKEIKIITKGTEILRIKTTKDVDANVSGPDILKLIDQHDYADIHVINRDGKKVSFKIEETIKY